MSDERRVVVRLFGPAREAAEAATVELELAPAATAADAIAELARAYPRLTPLLPRSRVAVNLEYVDARTPLAPATRSRSCRRSGAADGARPTRRPAAVGGHC